MLKRFIAIIFLIFFTGMNTCYAFSELHYLKNVKTTNIEPIITANLSAQDFEIIKYNPYYATSQDGKDSAIIILQQSGNNMFYYYQSDNNTKVNKYILKEIKRQNIVCEQSYNTNIINIYDNLAKNVIPNTNIQTQYTFEEPRETNINSANIPTIQQSTSLQGHVAQISSGTKIPVYLQSSINTATATKGEQIVAVISDNIKYNGTTIFPQGSLVYGVLSKARSATYGSRNGRVVIAFNQIVTPENKVYNISAEEIDFTVSNDGKFKTTAVNAVKTAAAGAIVGVLFALMTDNNLGRAAAMGAGIGAGSSAIYSTAEQGVDAEIPSFTELEVTLNKALSITVTQ